MQHPTPEDSENQTGGTPPGNVAPTPSPSPDQAANPASSGPSPFFLYTDEQEGEPDLQLPHEDVQAHQSAPYVLPFQHSDAMPTLAQMPAHGTQGSNGTAPSSATPPETTSRKGLFIVKWLLVVSVVLITLVGASFFVFAQSASPPKGTQTNGGTLASSSLTATPAQHLLTPTVQPAGAVGKPVPPTATRQNTGNPSQGNGPVPASGLPSPQVLNQLGWTQAGLSSADALEALRTAATFTEREMSYDYRAIGSLAEHGGTLTSSTFLLTPGGKIRFARNDVRVINNVLYNKIRTGKIIQQVVNAQPSLVQFQRMQVQGQTRQFAWVNVAFALFQSRGDPATGQRVEGMERDAATGQPVIHQMSVVLLRVAPQDQGGDAPMGGTGWLVNTYALDAATLPAIATVPLV